ncbi:unnamed protein product [Mytilus coruscus]|uniref:PiggyBac transposable element-derived protein domain-containing protein n=1 Tax=Mytilus coruscus TaxID=42192 RepID=A0A6J8DY01_MYTCO|nr:unnamed protein product [Mytilus coruscus]
MTSFLELLTLRFTKCMSDISEDSEVSDIESEMDSDVDLAQEITESESSEDENVPNQRPWFRIYPPEIDEMRQNFVENVGLQDAPPRNSRPISYFFLFMTMDFFRQIVTETNRYAADYIASKDRIQGLSRLHDWFKVGVLALRDLKAFLTVILNMGIIKKPVITEYWNTKFASQSTKWFREMFSRNWFQLILKFFHITNNDMIPNRDDPQYSPTGKFQCFVDLFNAKFKQYYTPNQSLSIDESLIGTRGRSIMIQYIPSKAAKFGVKLWVLAESITGYIVHLNVYKGKRYDPTPARMLQGNENEAKFLRQGQLLLCAYKEARRRKPVRLLSTACRAELNNTGKPKMTEYYNTKMGGVDLADQLVSAYVDDRKTMKVWKKIVFNLLQRMVTNAYILYKQNSDAPRLSRLSFLQSIIEDLAQEHLLSRQQRLPNRELNNARIRLRKVPDGKEKDCSGCSDRNGWNGRKRTRTVCVRCGNGLHKKCKHNHVCVEE